MGLLGFYCRFGLWCISKISTQIFNKWYLRLSCWEEFGCLAVWGFHWPLKNKIPCPFVDSSELRLPALLCSLPSTSCFCSSFLTYTRPYYMLPAWKPKSPSQAFYEWISAQQRPHTLPTFPWGPSSVLLDPMSLSGLISHWVEWLPGLSLHLDKNFLLRDSGLGT